MPSPILIQSDVDTALADFNTKLAAAVTAISAMYTVQFPATSYAAATAQAVAIKAAGDARDAIAKTLADAAGQGAAIAAQVKPLLPLS